MVINWSKLNRNALGRFCIEALHVPSFQMSAEDQSSHSSGMEAWAVSQFVFSCHASAVTQDALFSLNWSDQHLITTGINSCRRRTFHQLCAISCLLLGGGSAAGAQCWGLLPAIRGNNCMVVVARRPHCSLLPPGLKDAAGCVWYCHSQGELDS